MLDSKALSIWKKSRPTRGIVLLGDYAYSKKWFETHIEKYDNISNLFMLCSGLVIILIIFLSNIIAKRFMNRKILLSYLLFTSLLYIPMMLTLFPLSSNKMYYYMPASELAPGLSILFHQVFAIFSATICAIVMGIILKILKYNNPFCSVSNSRTDYLLYKENPRLGRGVQKSL